MRGRNSNQPSMFFAINVEDRIAGDHPLRPIRRMVDEELARLAPVFAAAYSTVGRPSVPPERLLKSPGLALHERCCSSASTRSAASGRSSSGSTPTSCSAGSAAWTRDGGQALRSAEPCFDATAFTQNRPRLEEFGIIGLFFDGVVRRAVDAGLTSGEHFSVDGTLIDSHAAMKSVRPIGGDGGDDEEGASGGFTTFKPRNPDVDFRGQRRTNATHRSTTDPEARLYRKGAGQPSRLCHMSGGLALRRAHAISENRHGLVVATATTEASGTGEATAALAMVDDLYVRGVRVDTLGADKGYDSGPLMLELEGRGITPHVAMNLSGDKRDVVGGRGRRVKADRPKIEARQRMHARLGGEG